MGMNVFVVGRIALAACFGVFVVGCGRTSDSQVPANEAGAGSGGSGAAQAGGGAIEAGGSSEPFGAAGAPALAGGPANGGGGQGTPSGVGGEAGGGTADACAVVHHVEVSIQFQTTSDPRIVKSGSEFAVTDGSTLLALSWTGELARQHFDRNVCPGCDGLFGITALRSAVDWRLLSVDRFEQGTAALAWRMSDPSPPDAQPLFGPEFSGLVSAFALGASRDGARAVFANGHRVVTQEVTFATVDADGRMPGPANTLEIPSPYWDYLSVVPTAHAAAVSVIAENVDRSRRVWLLSELDANGQLVFSSQSDLPADLQCVLFSSGGCWVVEDADGYYINLRGTTGPIRVARLLRDRPNELIINDDLMPPAGGLAAALPRTLVSLADDSAGTTFRTRFVGSPKSGAGEPQTLAVSSAVDAENRPRFQLIAVEGHSMFYGIQTRDTLLVEELACSTAL